MKQTRPKVTFGLLVAQYEAFSFGAFGVIFKPSNLILFSPNLIQLEFSNLYYKGI